MIYLDASILVAALVDIEPFHKPCARLLLSKEPKQVRPHALVETFSTLTGGRLSLRLPPATATSLIEINLLPRLKFVELTPGETVNALKETERRGIRGGAIHDYLHLASARKGKSESLFTLNLSHFRAFHRQGDPEVRLP